MIIADQGNEKFFHHIFLANYYFAYFAADLMKQIRFTFNLFTDLLYIDGHIFPLKRLFSV